MNLKSFLTGYALGLSGKPLPLANKEPVAYLYNGVRLPPLPEWDKETYPYAYIFPYGDTYRLRVFSVRMYYDEYTTSSETAATSAAFQTEGAVLGYKITDGEWELASTAPSSVPAYDTADPAGTRYSRMYYVWANTDILDYNDGSVYLATSVPIPVYE